MYYIVKHPAHQSYYFSYSVCLCVCLFVYVRVCHFYSLCKVASALADHEVTVQAVVIEQEYWHVAVVGTTVMNTAVILT